MKFFFPDSQDQIAPGFDFVSEEHAPHRIRQRDDLYAHEVLSRAPFDGLLVSKAIVDGKPGAAGKYTMAQRNRLYREGVRQFFRLDAAAGLRLATMGDCGAFSYISEDLPPYSPDEVIDFYAECGFDLGVSVDHIILAFAGDERTGELGARWQERQQVTLELATKFRAACQARRVRFEPVGVAQGWSPRSYLVAVAALQQMGYRRIALGGMVPLKTKEILQSLCAIDEVRRPDTQLHLLGITRCDSLHAFAAHGVTSFDSTSAFRQAFKDDHDNYYTLDRNYTALRVPQVDGNPKLKAKIRAGRLRQGEAIDREQACLQLLRAYDADATTLDRVLDALGAYDEVLWDGRLDRTDTYRQLLEDRPWKHCPCGICATVGIDVVIFRGSERNKRRGFHNTFVFRQRLQHQLAAPGP
jgi:hypothetical protein